MPDESDSAQLPPPQQYGTGIPSLDTVLQGGIHCRPESRPSVLIIGGPGCGKSTLGAAMAAGAVNQRGKSAAIFTLEETPDDLQYLMSQFRWNPRHCNWILDRDPRKPLLTGELTERLLAGIPSTLISYVPECSLRIGESDSDAERFTQLVHHIQDRVEKLNKQLRQQSSGAVDTIVVDGLPARVDDRIGSLSSYEQRALFKSLCELGNRLQSLIVIVAEQSARQPDWREFVGDIVMELGWSDAPSGRGIRYLQLLKTRYQPSMPGRHMVRILEHEGLYIYPRSEERLREARDQHFRSVDSSREVHFSTDEGLNRFLGREGLIRVGSTSLLFGEDETRKNLIAARFLQQGTREALSPAGNTRVLFITCGTSTQTARDILRNYWLKFESEPIHSSSVTIVEGPTIHESVDELLDRIEQVRLRSQAPFARAVVDDVAAFFSQDDYVHILREYLSSHGITSLFVRTVPYIDTDPLREHYDNVIRSRHLQLPTGDSLIGYRVMKLRGAAAGQSRSWQLTMSGPRNPVVLKDSLRNFRETPQGELRPIPWHLRLYFPAEDREDYWKREAQSLFNTVYAGADEPRVQSFGRLEADSVYQSICDIPEDYRLMGTEVINFDEYWGESLIDANRLELLEDAFTADELHTIESRFSKAAWQNAPRTRNGKLVGLPHHLDFGIYTVRTDVLERFGLKLGDICDPEGRPSWNAMAQAAAKIRREFRQQQQEAQVADRVQQSFGSRPSEQRPSDAETSQAGQLARIYELPQDIETAPFFDPAANLIDESFICFVLEILWPLLSQSSRFEFNTEEVQAALLQLHSHLEDLGAIPINESRHAIPLASNGSQRPPLLPVFERHWFVSYWWKLRRYPSLRERFEIVPPPVMTMANKTLPASSLRGDWHLGVVKGSPDLLRAASAIKSLTSDVASQNLLHNEIGLPPISARLNDPRLTQVSGETLDAVYHKTVSRRQIPAYNHIRSALAMQFRRIFCDRRPTSPANSRESLATLIQEACRSLAKTQLQWKRETGD